MVMTTLDPKTALVIIDLQKGLASYPTIHPIEEIAANAGRLAAEFRRNDLPVVLVNVTGGAPGRTEASRTLGDLPPDWAEFMPELGRTPQDQVVTKQTWGAFTNTDLEARLKATAITQIVLAGVATSIGVESTARFAYELGFNVTLATDAMTDMSQEVHDNSISRIFPRLGETGTTAEIIGSLGRKDQA